jgi:hypothetical protein
VKFQRDWAFRGGKVNRGYLVPAAKRELLQLTADDVASSFVLIGQFSRFRPDKQIQLFVLSVIKPGQA